MIDLRSDTVTKPTAQMRLVMSQAEVGDDVYGEDPTVNQLEQRAAAVTGKEAALFVPSGTMGNTIAIKLHTEHGQEVICDSRSHVLNYELSMMAWFAGCVARAIPTDIGLLSWDAIHREIRPVGPHAAATGLIAIENTHNMAGGTVYPIQTLQLIYAGAQQLKLPVHMDGARIFNAATALEVPVTQITQHCDSVMFCLSKGLGAPVGSILAGSQAAMDRGRLYRSGLGRMRQAGILAAAGLVALETMPQRPTIDHANAQALAGGLREIRGVRLGQVQTNIVIFSTDRPAALLSAEMRKRDILANPVGLHSLRMVTHFDVTAEMCGQAVDAVRSILTSN
ncbi:MAG: GntG family PLP-dependent aldolase [Bryobacteraceae bacterium]